MVLTKVFVGNLSFKTKEADLASEFSSAGKVVSANIITRGPRSLGYGFVELESEEDAQKAVALMNKKLIDSREINVEIAKPRDETKAANGDNANNAAGEGGKENGGNNYRGRRRGRGGARGGRGGGFGRVRRYRPRNQEGGEGSQPEAGGSSSPPRGGGRRGRGGPRRGGRGGRGGFGGRQNNNANRTPSQTTLFVANLPFSVDDAGLSTIFKDMKPKAAHIVKNRNGRSKGFGFVEFEAEDAQKAALGASENLEAEGRKLTVKIALTEIRTEEGQNQSGGAPAQGDSAPAKTEEKKSEATA